ncbi:MAG: condensation domain-containing protein, partial [Terracidiphilus sp.]
MRSQIAQIARRTPGASALEAIGRRSADYESLVNQIDETARWLTFRGIERNDRVAVVMPNGPEMASLFLGVSAVATCAPLNPAYRASEFEFYLSDLQPKIVIVDSAMDSAVRGVAGAAGIEIVELRRRDLEPAGSFALSPCGDSPTPVAVVDYAGASDIALVLHTSGTTSRPKIVPLTHENLCVSAANIAQSLDLTASDRCLNIMPLFHVHGLVGALLSSLCAGASVVCTPGYQATEFFNWLADIRPTWYTGVPTMHHGILMRAQANRAILAAHRLRFIRSCSAALAPKLMAELEEAFGAPVLEAYGMTEAAHQMSSNGLPPRPRKPGSVGRPTGVDIAIMNDAGALLQTGAEGEVVIRGRNVTRGYQNNPEANLKSFTDGWFRTGDQGRFDSDGDLFLTGRIKELIVRAGEKIPPREIDEALLSHPAVEQALGFAAPDEALGERVAAAVVLKAGASVTELELREHAAGLLADFKVPDRIIFVAEIPKGPTGKQQRIGLAEKLGLAGRAGPSAAAPLEYRAPRGATETRLAEMWREVLKLERAGVHDDFFAMGGDSILAGQLLARIRYAFGVELSAPRLFQLPTIAWLAEFIDGQSASVPADRALPSVNRKGGLALTSAQQRMWFLAESEPESPVYNRPFAYRLKGSLDLFRLQMSLDRVVERHEILRTNYHQHDGIATGKVRAPQPVSIALEDLSGQPASERESAALRWMRKESARPFKLESDSVIRAGLARLAPDEYILFLVIHHIACDASTEPVIAKDLADAYNGTISSSPLAQYADYAAWQCSREAAGREEQLAWWEQRLKGMDNACEIRGDFTRPQIGGYRGGSVPLQLDGGTLERCKSAARAANTTVFTVLLTAFYALLHRYTDAEDIVVGTPVSIRNHPAAESMAGLFINTLALRASAAGNPTFSDFVGRVRETVAGGLAHQEVPFDAIVNVLRSERGGARASLFQAMFEYRNIGKSHLAMEGIAAERMEFDCGFAVTPFDLTLDMEPGGAELRGNFYYNAEVFEHATIECMARHFATLLGHALDSPSEKLSQLRLLMAEEQLPPNGKIGRKAPPLPEAAPDLVAEEENPPSATPVEVQLAGIWAEVLHREPIGIRENFFDMGGHSLSAMRAAVRIRSVFAMDFAV